MLAGAAVSGSVLSRLPFFRPKATAGSEASAAARAVSVGVVARQPTEGGVASAAAAAPPARSTERRTNGRTNGSRDRLFLVLNFLSAFAVVRPSRLQSLSLFPSRVPSSLPPPHAHKHLLHDKSAPADRHCNVTSWFYS